MSSSSSLWMYFTAALLVLIGGVVYKTSTDSLIIFLSGMITYGGLYLAYLAGRQSTREEE